MNSPGLRAHRLYGKGAGYRAVNVSDTWRVVFRFDGKYIVNVDYLNYH